MRTARRNPFSIRSLGLILLSTFYWGSVPAHAASWNGVPKTFVQPIKATPPKKKSSGPTQQHLASNAPNAVKAMFEAATKAYANSKGMPAAFAQRFSWVVVKPQGCEVAAAPSFPVEPAVRTAVLESGHCYEQLTPPWSKALSANWVIDNLGKPPEWEKRSTQERIQLLSAYLEPSSDAVLRDSRFLALSTPPRGKALCEAVLVLLTAAKTDKEQMQIAPLLPLDVPECDQAQLKLCDRLAPEGQLGMGGIPSRVEVLRNGCTQAATRIKKKQIAQGYDVALKNFVSMKDIFNYAGKDTASLTRALETCVEDSERDYPAETRQACLSSLAAIDVAKARVLLDNNKVWFATTTKHFELSSAVVLGQSPLNRLITLGLVPPGFTREPWESQYPTDILEAAKVMTDTGEWDDTQTAKVIALGNTALSTAHTTFDTKKRKFTVWFNGERVEATLEGNPRRQLGTVAGVLNVLAERAGLAERWWVHDEEPRVLVGAEEKLKQAVTEGLVSGR